MRLKDECEGVLLLAGDDIRSLEAVMPCEASALDYFCGIAPVVMFLRNAIGVDRRTRRHKLVSSLMTRC